MHLNYSVFIKVQRKFKKIFVDNFMNNSFLDFLLAFSENHEAIDVTIICSKLCILLSCVYSKFCQSPFNEKSIVLYRHATARAPLFRTGPRKMLVLY